MDRQYISEKTIDLQSSTLSTLDVRTFAHYSRQRWQNYKSAFPAEDALLLSISVDPTYDTPAVLLDYGTKFDADFTRWHFLTGEEKQTRAVIESFQTVFEHAEQSSDTNPNILHSEQFILVDTFGEIRGFFDDSPEGLNELMRAIDAL